MSCTGVFPANVTQEDKCCFDQQGCADFVCSALNATIYDEDYQYGNTTSATSSSICYVDRADASNLFNQANLKNNGTCRVMLCIENTSFGYKNLRPIEEAPWLLWLGIILGMALWNAKR
ncbi:hypothetical protein IAU59_001371 [Kwoniella sp. CBS 9459]